MEGGFKVIIVGGGPVGLSAAHALRLAGIDFVVLERRSQIVENAGTTTVVAAHTLRVLHQFGILDSLRAIGTEVAGLQTFDAKGNSLGITKFKVVEEM